MGRGSRLGGLEGARGGVRAGVRGGDAAGRSTHGDPVKRTAAGPGRRVWQPARRQ